MDYRALALGSSLLMALGCGDDGSGDASTTGDSTTAATVNETTLPITISDTSAETSVSASNTATETETNGTTTDGTATDGTTTDGTSTGSTSDDATTGSTGDEALEVEWCILQYPPTIPVPDAEDPVGPGEDTEVYTRFFVETVTDQTDLNDEDDRIVVEVGYGADGSDPSAGTWTWTAAVPNPGWDGSEAPEFGSENNDEYWADLSFDAAGVYDYASRVSADGGRTWVYCDLDGLTEGGYTAEQAGDATITE
jgi:hypothetical protein